MTVATEIAGRLGEAVGAKRVVAAEEELAAYAVDGLAPSAIVKPISPEEAAEVVRFAVAEKLALLPLGSKSKCDLGMTPERYDIAVDMTGLRSIAHFDPGDLTLSVDAGLPLRELDSFVRQHGQFLPLAVPCFESTTAGGTIASGIDSALRLQYGFARDFLIGAEFIDGTGQLCKSGGRVVKNVTGYDLHKLLIGSSGTLGIITRLNFRTFPLPATFGGHLCSFNAIEGALEYRKSAENAGLPLANLELLSPKLGKIICAILEKAGQPHAPELEQQHDWLVYSSFDGNEEVVRRIGHELKTIALETGAVNNRILEAGEDLSLGGMLRESFEWLRWASPATVICRLPLPEMTAATLAQLFHLAESEALRSALLVRTAGIVYFAVFADAKTDRVAEQLTKVVGGARSIAQTEQASCALLHAPPAIKKAATTNAMADLRLQQSVKRAFDPSNVFAPGRVVGGI